jgi:hypothetical protein
MAGLEAAGPRATASVNFGIFSGHSLARKESIAPSNNPAAGTERANLLRRRPHVTYFAARLGFQGDVGYLHHRRIQCRLSLTSTTTNVSTPTSILTSRGPCSLRPDAWGNEPS